MIDLHILGLGISPGEHLTPETVRALASCREVFYLDASPASGALLAKYAPKVTSLYSRTYAEGGERIAGYRGIAAAVIEAALRAGPVGFAAQGHPYVYVHASRLMREAGARLGLKVKVYPAISSLDTAFADLGLDPAREGLQVYEATDLLLRRRPLQPDVPALLWQVGNLETRLHSTRRSRPERLFRFVEHLAQWYPPEHRVTVYFASPHPLVPTYMRAAALNTLPSIASELHPGVSLYLPPTAARPVVDVALLALLDDPAHLEKITS